MKAFAIGIGWLALGALLSTHSGAQDSTTTVNGWIKVLLSTHASAQDSTTTVNGWMKVGDTAPDKYEIGVDPDAMHRGHVPSYLRSTKSVTGGYSTLMRRRSASAFAGKRVRMSGWVMSAEVGGWAGLWMRVEGREHESVLAFDKMDSRPIKGTTPWTRYSVVLDVPREADQIAYGAILYGVGALWLDGPDFEIVDASVPTTGKDLGSPPQAPPHE